eukprot:TRINITY_DN248_c0_g1_i2.p1 TRINITY_DN248_c0_g1~~TRINITY_DN248_c0_g1_i2.p1  ORF type:complete len:279 (-),score=56.59 TRINITY_DN248_c0_g1_i2:63-899(-)
MSLSVDPSFSPYVPKGLPVFLSHPIINPKLLLNEHELTVIQSPQHYLDGTKKRELSHWWLQHIEDQVDSYLTKIQGYVVDAVPYHYIDQPPKSLKAIENNLRVVHALLDDLKVPFENPTRSNLVEILKKEVYSVINTFHHDLYVILWDNLTTLNPNTHLSLTSPTFLNDATTLLSQNAKQINTNTTTQNNSNNNHNDNNTIPPSLINSLSEILQDIRYIDEMKNLDRIFFEDMHNEEKYASNTGPADTVPVTGLIVSKLHRIENELKTVLTHWKGRVM